MPEAQPKEAPPSPPNTAKDLPRRSPKDPPFSSIRYPPDQPFSDADYTSISSFSFTLETKDGGSETIDFSWTGMSVDSLKYETTLTPRAALPPDPGEVAEVLAYKRENTDV